jgi:hypothetical protein
MALTVEQIKQIRQNVGLDRMQENYAKEQQKLGVESDLVLRLRGIAAEEKRKKDLEISRQYEAPIGPEVQPKKPGFLEELGSSIKSRAGEIKETWQETVRGDITPAETGLQTVGKTFGLAGDILGQVLISGIKAITPDIIEDKVKQAGIKALQSESGQKAVEALSLGIDKYEEWKKENPRIAKNIESVVDIAQFAPVARGAKITEKSVIGATKIAEKVTSPVIRAGEGITKFSIAQASGLSNDTIKILITNPKGVSTAMKEGLDRVNMGNIVKEALEKKIKDVGLEGAEYQVIRELPKTVQIPENTITKVLDKFKLTFDKKGKLKITKESIPMKSGDISALEDFLNMFSGEKELSSNAFLNARKTLDDMAKWETGKSDASTALSKELRKAFDDLGKKQIPELAELDAKFAPEKQILNELKKDLMSKGKIKDNFYSIIAGMTRKGKLQRLKELVPDIEENVKILNALEDIEYAKGQKVGAYIRGGILGGGVVSGNIPLVIAGLLAYPGSMKTILINYGIAAQKAAKIMSELKQGTTAALSGSDKAAIGNAIKFYIEQEKIQPELKSR